MLSSFYSGLSGLSAHVVGMDVLGNNIANINTIGFKASSPIFQDILSQSAGRSFDSGSQIGRGVCLGGISPSFSQGAFQNTDVATHLAIQGNGFFVLGDDSGDRYYTRAGNFVFDKEYDLVNPNGLSVLGWQTVTDTGVIDTSGTASAIHLPIGMTMDPQATTMFKTNINLDTEATVDNPSTSANEAEIFSTSLTTYDSLGAAHTITLEFTPIDENGDSILDRWDWIAYVDASEVDASSIGSGAGQLPPTADGTGVIIARGDGDAAPTGNAALDFEPMRFDSSGTLMSNTGLASLDFASVDWANGAEDQQVSWQVRSEADMDTTYLTGYSLTSAISYTYQDGVSVGEMESVVIRGDGTIIGQFSNGTTKAVAQIALATFPAPTSLTIMGENLFGQAPGSGNPTIGTANTGGRGTMVGQTLEMANSDLTTQFTSMITMQRGFEANSKIITTADEMIRQMLNLKR
ncbi:MAG: flagellar hook protein FlgE [Candidatus Coatesbacteria bacterium]|nr:flagellar hook protein FlgE [Candidatus Coatesbacteria bacterium]